MVIQQQVLMHWEETLRENIIMQPVFSRSSTTPPEKKIQQSGMKHFIQIHPEILILLLVMGRFIQAMRLQIQLLVIILYIIT
jgi:hypothetical protein